MCGGLETALRYLDMAAKLERRTVPGLALADPPSRDCPARSSEWMSHIESAERALKWLAFLGVWEDNQKFALDTSLNIGTFINDIGN